MGPVSSCLILSQFSAVTATRPAAPAAMRAIPSGSEIPENARIAPITSSAAARTAYIPAIGPVSSCLILSQFKAAAAARPAAPITINAIPRGRFAPVKARIAPRTSAAPETKVKIFPIEPSICSFNVSQSSPAAAAMDAAPNAIRAIPRGILTPEKARIAPSTRKASPSSSSRAPILPSISAINPPSKLGVMAPAASLPPLPEEELSLRIFSWSKDASCLLAFWAALPAFL